MREILLLISTPLISLALLAISGSYLGSVLPLELKAADTPTWQIGLLTTGFYIGYIYGCFRLMRYIYRVGHIRAFAAFGAVIAVVTIAHGYESGVMYWVGLRLIYGICVAGALITIESWLMEKCEFGQRGMVMGMYMFSFYAAQALGQLMLKFDGIGTMECYSVAGILVCLAIIPFALTKIPAPTFSPDHQSMGIFEIIKLSLTGATVSFCGGLVVSTIYGIFPVVLRASNYTLDEVSYAMFSVIFGGMALQYPIGRLSDFIDRRFVLIICSVGCMMVLGALIVSWELIDIWGICIFMFVFGGFTFCYYPLGVNLICDVVDNDSLIAALSTMLVTFSVGSCMGPLIASSCMRESESIGWLGYCFAINVLIMAVIVRGLLTRKPVSAEDQETFMNIPARTTTVALDEYDEELAQLSEEEEQV